MRSGGEDGANVFEVLFGTAFPVKKKFVGDDGFGRGEPIGTERGGELPRMREFPAGEFAAARKVAIRGQGTVLMDDVEVSAGFASDFGKQDFGGGKVKVVCREAMMSFSTLPGGSERTRSASRVKRGRP